MKSNLTDFKFGLPISVMQRFHWKNFFLRALHAPINEYSEEKRDATHTYTQERRVISTNWTKTKKATTIATQSNRLVYHKRTRLIFNS